MKVELTKEELELLNKDKERINLILLSKAIYNESLEYKFDEEDLKKIWFAYENLILELYMIKKVEPRIMINENTIAETYKNNKEYFETNKINFENAREIIIRELTSEMNKGLFEDLVKKLMHEMEEKISLSKEDILFTKGNPELIKSILLINVLKENAKKENFFNEFSKEIETIKKDTQINYYLDKIVSEKLILTNEEVLNETQRFTKENFDKVKQYSQDELFNYVGQELYNQKYLQEKYKYFDEIMNKYEIEKLMEEYIK